MQQSDRESNLVKINTYYRNLLRKVNRKKQKNQKFFKVKKSMAKKAEKRGIFSPLEKGGCNG